MLHLNKWVQNKAWHWCKPQKVLKLIWKSLNQDKSCRKQRRHNTKHDSSYCWVWVHSKAHNKPVSLRTSAPSKVGTWTPLWLCQLATVDFKPNNGWKRRNAGLNVSKKWKEGGLKYKLPSLPWWSPCGSFLHLLMSSWSHIVCNTEIFTWTIKSLSQTKRILFLWTCKLEKGGW